MLRGTLVTELLVDDLEVPAEYDERPTADAERVLRATLAGRAAEPLR